MKRLITGVAAAALLAGMPFVASAHDDDHDRGWDRGHHYGQDKRNVYVYRDRRVYYRPVPPPVVYYPAPRFVAPPVYVAPPAPVVVYPQPMPAVSSVDIGFRFFF